MKINAGNGYIIKIPDTPESGNAWIVRLYRKRLFFKKLVTSDWFLDREQARTFGEQLSRDIQTQGSAMHIKHRPPGWTLNRPAR